LGALDLLNRPQSKLDGLADARRLQLLIDAIVDYAIYMIDLDGTVRSWNTGAERLKGYSADEIIGKPFSLFYSPEDRAKGLPQTALRIASETGRLHGPLGSDRGLPPIDFLLRRSQAQPWQSGIDLSLFLFFWLWASAGLSAPQICRAHGMPDYKSRPSIRRIWFLRRPGRSSM